MPGGPPPRCRAVRRRDRRRPGEPARREPTGGTDPGSTGTPPRASPHPRVRRAGGSRRSRRVPRDRRRRSAVRRPTWFPARPTPGAAYIVSSMSSTIRRSASSNAWAGDAVSRSTGSPSVRICITVTMFPPTDASHRSHVRLGLDPVDDPRRREPAHLGAASEARAASTATKHIVAPTPDESNVPGSSAASSRSSSAPPVTRNTGDPTGSRPRPGAGSRSVGTGRVVPRRGPGPRSRSRGVGLHDDPSVRTGPRRRLEPRHEYALASVHAGTTEEASACRMPRGPGPASPHPSAHRRRPPAPRARVARGGSSRPISDTGTVATPRAHSSTRSAPRRAMPKSVPPQEAHRPAPRTTQRMLPRSSRSMPRHDAHAAGSPQDLQTLATP